MYSHSNDNYSIEEIENHINSFYNKCVKRIIDFVLAVIGLIATSPLLIILSILIVAETGFPIMYRPLRGGYRGKPFRICKFRTMVKNADQIGGGTTALNDKRITKVGMLLRKTKLDEFPQLLNILLGNMSFIGPRPELIKYTEKYDDKEKLILGVKPGITDFSSISYINLDEIVGEYNADDNYEALVLPQKNQLRLKYVASVSLVTDVILFGGTIFSVIKKSYRYGILHIKKH